MAPSSSGLGHDVLNVGTGVRFSLGLRATISHLREPASSRFLRSGRACISAQKVALGDTKLFVPPIASLK